MNCFYETDNSIQDSVFLARLQQSMSLCVPSSNGTHDECRMNATFRAFSDQSWLYGTKFGAGRKQQEDDETCSPGYSTPLRSMTEKSSETKAIAEQARRLKMMSIALMTMTGLIVMMFVGTAAVSIINAYREAEATPAMPARRMKF
jgi:hypothetical protein